MSEPVSGSPTPDDVLRVVGLHALGDDPPAEAVESALRALGEHAHGADPLRRETLRGAALRIL